MNSTYSGIECPECGSIDLKVLETRRTPNAVIRRRSCDRRHKFNTVEIVSPGDVSLTAAVFAIDQAIQSLQARVNAARAEHPDDSYYGLAQLEDVELLKAAAEMVRSVGLPENCPN